MIHSIFRAIFGTVWKDLPEPPPRDYLAEVRGIYSFSDDGKPVKLPPEYVYSTVMTSSTPSLLIGDRLYTGWLDAGTPPYVKPHAHTYAGRVKMLGPNCQRCRS
jgi:hypothetical protein